MEPYQKKRKPDENGSGAAAPAGLTRDDVLRIIEPFSRDQLADIIASAACRGGAVLDAVRSLSGRDSAQRKLFIRGLGWETTADTLRSVFSAYGHLDEAVVITDKTTGKSKGYGFITFRHVDGAILALKDPSKKIDGRMTVAQLATSGGSASGPAVNPPMNTVDISLRKIFVGNVPSDIPSERLLSHFASYGEIEEGPLGFDKQNGKFRGFALFVYKTAEGAQSALAEPTKVLDGHQLVCKLAVEGKKGKSGGQVGPAAGPGSMQSQQMGANPDMGRPGLPLSGQYGGPGTVTGTGLSSYGGLATTGVAPVGNNAGPGGFGSGAFGSVAQFGGTGLGLGGFGGIGLGNMGNMGNMGGSGSSLYRMPPVQGGFPEGGNYPPLGPSGTFRNVPEHQHPHPQMGLSPGPGSGPRVPGGPGFYPNIPPYY